MKIANSLWWLFLLISTVGASGALPTLTERSSVNVSKNTVSITSHTIGTSHFVFSGGDSSDLHVHRLSEEGILTHLSSYSLHKNKGPVRGLIADRISGTDFLFVGNKRGNAVEVYRIYSDGKLERVFVVEDTPETHLGVVITLQPVHFPKASYLYVGGLEDTPGLSSFRIEPNGHLTHVQSMADSSDIFTDGIIGMSIHRTKEDTYLYTGGFQDNGVSSFRLSPDGTFSPVAALSDDPNHYLTGTYPLISVSLKNKNYLVVGHRHHIHYQNTSFIKKQDFFYHGDAITCLWAQPNGTITPRSILKDDASTLLRGQTRIASLPGGKDHAWIAVATRDDESIQLCRLHASGRLTAELAYQTNFPIYYGLQSHLIGDRKFLIAGSVSDGRLKCYELRTP